MSTSDIRSRTERLVEAAIVDEHGASALTRGPISSTITIEVTRPANWLHGVAAARRVGYAAEAIARDQARKARGEGRSWAEVAQALGIAADETQDPAIEAFRWVAPEPSQPYDPITTSWECVSCGARVRDVGPFSGHPDDEQEGHAAGCSRHADDIAAWRETSGWDED